MHRHIKSLFFITLLLLVSSCGSDGNNDNPSLIGDANWTTSSTVRATAGSATIAISGPVGLEWSATINNEATWCSFDGKASQMSISGTITDGLNVKYVYFTANTTSVQRTAKVSFQFEGQEVKVLTLTQLSESEQDVPAFDVWAEIPVYKESANYLYVTHYTPLNDKNVRNYSICFDKTKKAALWVAYPIHQSYFGSMGRWDKWSFDPNIPSQYQADCTSYSYRGDYDRGHQIASADRTANEGMNAQTFYTSNITPQLDRLNQDMWAKLEAKVRSYSCLDTLYVVTGAYFGSNAPTTKDGAGNVVPIPTNYFKVLLRTNRGNTGKNIKNCSDSELRTIGFWVDQKSYGDIQPPTEICTTVEDIESKTGFTFFPQVSSTVKKQKNLSDWGF